VESDGIGWLSPSPLEGSWSVYSLLVSRGLYPNYRDCDTTLTSTVLERVATVATRTQLIDSAPNSTQQHCNTCPLHWWSGVVPSAALRCRTDSRNIRPVMPLPSGFVCGLRPLACTKITNGTPNTVYTVRPIVYVRSTQWRGQIRRIGFLRRPRRSQVSSQPHLTRARPWTCDSLACLTCFLSTVVLARGRARAVGKLVDGQGRAAQPHRRDSS
jgi:hypothetical protein